MFINGKKWELASGLNRDEIEFYEAFMTRMSFGKLCTAIYYVRYSTTIICFRYTIHHRNALLKLREYNWELDCISFHRIKYSGLAVYLREKIKSDQHFSILHPDGCTRLSFISLIWSCQGTKSVHTEREKGEKYATSAHKYFWSGKCWTWTNVCRRRLEKSSHKVKKSHLQRTLRHQCEISGLKILRWLLLPFVSILRTCHSFDLLS